MIFKLNKTNYLITFLVFTVFMVYGCSSIENKKPDKSKKNSSFYKYNKKGFNKNKYKLYHKVKKGDSLYSIAWEYGMDFKRLAWINRIKPPYLIKKGQSLRLKSKQTINKYTKSKASSKTKTKTKTKAKKKSSKKKLSKIKTKQYKKKNNNKSVKNNNNSKTVAVKNKVSHKYKKNLNWSWPIKGRIIQYFSPAKGKKGIDIAVPNKAPVKSAESGKVVYSGHGLTGYGHLIIIKHNNKYLSAYAHNSKLIVAEGAVVKRRQVIAYSGKTSAERVKLHFEIRKDGKPVNPLNYLPK